MSLWSDPKPGSPRFILTYAAVAALALLELVVAWQAIHPHVPEDYRAYYIDQTTTCMRQPVTGAYVLGSDIDFRSGGDNTRELRPCGWEGPVGDGMHALGETTRLRFAVSAPNQPLVLTLELTAVTLPDAPEQRIVISANGTPLGTTTRSPGQTARTDFAVPSGLASATGLLDIKLDFPDAIRARPGDSNTRKRSVKLTEARLAPVAP